MKTIYKYSTFDSIDIPGGFKIVKFTKDYMWALVSKDADNATITIQVECFGTGWELPYGMEYNYIDTLSDGPLVWHYFWRQK